MPTWGKPVVRVDRPAPAVTMYPSITRVVLWTLVSAPFLAAGSYYTGIGDRVSGIAIIVVFGAFPALLLGKLLARRPVLIVDGRGITDCTAITGRRFLPWSEITALSPRYNGPGRSWISVDVMDPARFAEKAGFMGRLNTRFFGGAMHIMTATLPLSIADTLAEIEAVAPEHVLVVGAAPQRRR